MRVFMQPTAGFAANTNHAVPLCLRVDNEPTLLQILNLENFPDSLAVLERDTTHELVKSGRRFRR